MQIEQNAKIPKYKHDKIQKDKIRIAKIQMQHNTGCLKKIGISDFHIFKHLIVNKN